MASFSRASSRASNSSSGSHAGTDRSCWRSQSPPRFCVCLRRARSMRMRRMAVAAAAKKWPRSLYMGPWRPTRRKYASCTNPVASSVCPGVSLAKFRAASLRSSSYTNGNSWLAAWGSPCATASRIWVIWSMPWRIRTDDAARNEIQLTCWALRAKHGDWLSLILAELSGLHDLARMDPFIRNQSHHSARIAAQVRYS